MDQKARGHLENTETEKPREESITKRVTNCVKCYEVKYEKKKVLSRLVIRRSSVTFVRAFKPGDGHGDYI